MKKMKCKIKCIKFGYILYGLAIIALAYLIYTMALSFDYINSMVKQGQVSYSNNISEIILYLIDNCGINLFYTISFSVYGYICVVLQKLLEKSTGKDVASSDVVHEDIE